MRTALGIFAVIAAIGAGSALAAGMNDQTTGTVKSINQSENTITLQNGEKFNVAKDVNLANIKSGEKVTVTFSKNGDMMDATAVQKAR